MTIRTTYVGVFYELENLLGFDWFQVAGDPDMAHPTARYAGDIEEIGYQAGILFAHATRDLIQVQSEAGMDIFTDDELCWIGVVGM